MKTLYGYPLIVLIKHEDGMLDVSDALVDTPRGPRVDTTLFLDIVARHEQRGEYADRYQRLQR